MGSEIFNHFEKITNGQKVNREIMLGNLAYYFDEGFEIEEMNLLISNRYKEDYFRQNPEKFNIQNIFPIKDQDRINIAWDALAYFQKSMHSKAAVQKDISNESLKNRILSGDKLAILEDPELASQVLPEGDLKSIALWFMVDRSIDKSMKHYAIRTYPLRKEICDELNIKIGTLENIHEFMGKMTAISMPRDGNPSRESIISVSTSQGFTQGEQIGHERGDLDFDVSIFDAVKIDAARKAGVLKRVEGDARTFGTATELYFSFIHSIMLT